MNSHFCPKPGLRAASLAMLLSALTFSLATSTLADDALTIAEDGTVHVAGTLTAGAVSAPNLEKMLADIQSQNKQILEALTWVKFTDNLYDAMTQVQENWINLTTNYEFMMVRNGGMRRLHFSSWNRDTGMRVMTERYMTGDDPPFRVGGSMWTLSTTQQCGVGLVYHLYYFNGENGVQTEWGNDCVSESPVFYRKRLIPELTPENP